MTVRGRIVVIGVGNEFRRDDGVGPVVIARLREGALPAGTVPAVSDGDPGRLMGLWENAGLAVVVDAARAHPGCPGRVHRLEPAAGRVLARRSAAGSHGLGLAEAMELSRALGRAPGRLVVYAVEGADTSLGVGLTEGVAAAVEAVVGRIHEEIARHFGAGDARIPAR
ncbi:hydrogenase maturation protease [Streptomyces orinoci]|uniref:Hydrogenase maturation protease n=1 Tax=Streptomyces orinoci TaxID=67339 RepID=A0ABV3JZV8_STRON|nr:hydrogenase maturation protease [Streptomyces orinoci]